MWKLHSIFFIEIETWNFQEFYTYKFLTRIEFVEKDFRPIVAFSKFSRRNLWDYQK